MVKELTGLREACTIDAVLESQAKRAKVVLSKTHRILQREKT